MYRINCELEEYRVRSTNTTLLNLYSGAHPIGTPKVGIQGRLHFWVPSSFFSHSERRYRNLWIRDWNVERSLPADEVCTVQKRNVISFWGFNLLKARQQYSISKLVGVVGRVYRSFRPVGFSRRMQLHIHLKRAQRVRFGIGTTNRKLIHLFFLWFLRQGANFIRLADSFGETISQGWIIWTVHRHGNFWNWTVGTIIAESRIENVICGVKTPGWQI